MLTIRKAQPIIMLTTVYLFLGLPTLSVTCGMPTASANLLADQSGNSVKSMHQRGNSVGEDLNIGPQISFSSKVFDLGEVGQSTKNTCEFRFTNTGRGLLKIGKISRTCGCTVFQLDKKEYTPNEIIHSFWPAYKRPFLWPCGRRPVFATKFTLQANPAENTKLVTKQRKSA